MRKFIPYGRQSIDESDISAVTEVLRTPYITCGPALEIFEKALAEKTGARYAVAVSSGTAALHIAYLAAGLKQGDELITTPLTFAATANAALYAGTTPVFVDIQTDTANINPEGIEAVITEKTRIIAPVHYAGQPADMTEIAAIAAKNNITVIEDACHALGAIYKSYPVGSCQYSDMCVFSFHPVKHITTGEGGAITTNNKDLYEKLLLYRSHGIITSNDKNWEKNMILPGYNYRLTDIQAALGTSQLKRLDHFIARRKDVAHMYDKYFACKAGITPLKTAPDRVHAYHLYPVLLDKGINRDKFIINAREKGIGLQVHYGLVYKHPYYQQLGYSGVSLPIAEDISSRIVSLPIFADITDEEVGYTASTLFEVI